MELISDLILHGEVGRAGGSGSEMMYGAGPLRVAVTVLQKTQVDWTRYKKHTSFNTLRLQPENSDVEV